jgi:hypothetical protein
MIIISGTPALALIAVMSDDDLKNIDGQFSQITLESFYEPNDTVRIFLDLHQELYGSIDSVKAGYYYRTSSELQTNMCSVGLSGYEGFYDVQQYNNGANFNFAKVTSDFNTLAPQGSATIEPWGNGGFSEKDPVGTLTPNSNHYDWDLWLDNVKIGESPDKPVYVNGLVMRFEFDGDLTDGSKDNLRRIIIGSNDVQGNVRGNYQRFTGLVNPMLLAHTGGRSAGTSDPYRCTGGSMQMIRDSYLQFCGINVFNVEDRDTGAWLILNLTGNRIAFELIGGWPENAIDFSYTSGLKSIPLWDPDWSPHGNGPLKDPYDTMTQIESIGHELE